MLVKILREVGAGYKLIVNDEEGVININLRSIGNAKLTLNGDGTVGSIVEIRIARQLQQFVARNAIEYIEDIADILNGDDIAISSRTA